VIEQRRTEIAGGMRQTERQAGIVELRVAVDDAAAQAVLCQGGHEVTGRVRADELRAVES